MTRAGDALDLEISRLSRLQHGVWSRRQAIAAGVTPRMIHSRLHRGLWIAQDVAVYAHAASEPTWHRSILAAVLAEPVAVASHRTAAVLHGIVGFRPGRPEITIAPGANARGRLSLAHRGIDAPATKRDGIPVTTVAQTFVDLAQVCSERRVRDALESWLVHDDRTLAALRNRYVALAPRGGRDLRPLRRILDALGDEELPTESELELQLHRAMASPRIPSVHWQATFPGRSEGDQRVDGVIHEWSLIVEGDGRSWHTRTRDFERDRRRDAEAAAAGLLTLRFTWDQLVHELDWVRDITVATGAHRVRAA